LKSEIGLKGMIRASIDNYCVEYLGVDVPPEITTYLALGRNIATLIEDASLSQKLKKQA
jgi:hypothetical protein